MFCNVFGLLIASLVTWQTYATDVVYHGEQRQDYYVQLLHHILAYAKDKDYQLSAFGQYLPKYRDFEIMTKGEGIDVVMGGSTLDREHIALPIRFPLLKGLNGWRIPLVHKSQENMFAEVVTMEQFRRLVPGQFHTWSDTKVLESNGIKVQKGSSSEGLYAMLEKKRFDYFPRSVIEIEANLSAHKDLNITIDPYVLIYYPTAFYYYVNKDNVALAQDIKMGLEQALADGSFDRLFMEHYGGVITKFRQQKRRIFQLENPYLSDKTPLKRQELWLDLSQ